MPPPVDAAAGPIEDEIRQLDQKIRSGQAAPGDFERYQDLIRMLQEQGSLAPVGRVDLKRVRYRLPPQLAFGTESRLDGFSTQVSAAATSPQPACSEFNDVFYGCDALPWETENPWTRTDESGVVSLRSCVPDDACVSEGVLLVESRESPLFYRVEGGLVTARIASTSFRMRQTIGDKRPPEPDGRYWGGGAVWMDDGLKSTAVGFVEDYFGQKLVLVPIAVRFDAETGELDITEVITAYHDWSAWHEYRLVKDAQGMVELFVDTDPVPIVAYPYDALDMGTLGGPAVMFGHLIDGDNSKVTSEYDFINYSVGMPDTGGCTSSNGKMQLLALKNTNQMFDPNNETNDVVGVVKVQSIDGLGSNTQSHTFFIKSTRTIKDAEGVTVRVTRDDLKIGPDGSGKSPTEVLAIPTSTWDGRDSSSRVVPFGTYSYSLSIEVVRVDKKQNEKPMATIAAAGTATTNDVCGGNGYRRYIYDPVTRRYIASGCNCYTGYVFRGLICTIPFDFDGTFSYNFSYLNTWNGVVNRLYKSSKTPWSGPWWPAADDSINVTVGTSSPAKRYQAAFGSSDPRGRPVDVAVHQDFGPPSCGGVCESDGVCDSWSNAAVLEPEPRHSVLRGGQEFSIVDIKALTTLMYTRRETIAFEGTTSLPITPGRFHMIMANMIGKKRQAMRADYFLGNNHPIFAYKIVSRSGVKYHSNGTPSEVVVTARVYGIMFSGIGVSEVTSDVVNQSKRSRKSNTKYS